MRSVQTRTARRWAGTGRVLLTCLAAVLVLAALTTPPSLEEMRVSAFLRLPLEALALLAVVLLLPPRFARLRTAVALAGGAVLGLAAAFKLLDLGFVAALNRPFDPLIDWRYAGSLVELVRDALGAGWGTLLLVVAGAAVLGMLVLVPLAVLRLTRVAARHRPQAAGLVAGLTATWLVLAMLDVRGPAGPLASRDTATYVEGQVTRIPGQLRDRREFLAAARTDPLRDVPGEELFAGLRGKDVLVVFVESYGRVALEDPALSPASTPCSRTGTGGWSTTASGAAART